MNELVEINYADISGRVGWNHEKDFRLIKIEDDEKYTIARQMASEEYVPGDTLSVPKGCVIGIKRLKLPDESE